MLRLALLLSLASLLLSFKTPPRTSFDVGVRRGHNPQVSLATLDHVVPNDVLLFARTSATDGFVGIYRAEHGDAFTTYVPLRPVAAGASIVVPRPVTLDEVDGEERLLVLDCARRPADDAPLTLRTGRTPEGCDLFVFALRKRARAA